MSNGSFELYGREVAPPPTHEEQSKERKPAVSETSSVFDSFLTQAYAHPGRLSPDARRDALYSAYCTVQSYECLYMRSHSSLWMKALSLATSTTSLGGKFWEERYLCAFTLYRQGRFLDCLQFRADIIDSKKESLNRSNPYSLSYALKFVAVIVMTFWRCGVSMDEKEIKCAEKLLNAAKDCSPSSSEQPEVNLLEASEILCWALDWTYQSGCASLSLESRESLLLAAPQRVRPFLFVNTPVTSLGGFQWRNENLSLSAWGLSLFIQQTTSVNELHRLYEWSKRLECNARDFGIFGLAKLSGEALLRLHPHHERGEQIVLHLGSSLHPQVLESFGNSRKGFSLSLRVLSQMSGPQAYFALKGILFHKPIDEMRRIQESHGDVLDGAAREGKTWSQALAVLEECLQNHSAWHDRLPHTLRLVSDAGKAAIFFRLVSNYNITGGSTANLSVASSLAQVLRYSSSWWHAIEVLDLISASAPPQSETDEGFLRDACLQTLHVLRSARKWESALSFYRALEPVMPPQCHRWMCSMATALKSSAPWKRVLEILSKEKKIPEKFLVAINCIHSDETIPSDSHSRNHVLHCLVEHGKWEKILLAASQTGREREKAIEAAWKTETPLPPTFFDSIPAGTLKNEQLMSRAFALAIENGILDNLLVSLKRGSTDLSKDWAVMTEAVLKCTPLKEIKHGFSSLSAAKILAGFIPPWRKNNFLRISKECFDDESQLLADLSPEDGKWKCQIQDTRKEDGLTFVSIQCCAFKKASPDLILFSNEGFIAAYKPYGVDSFSFALGISHALYSRTYYSLAMELPCDTCGVLLLFSPTIVPSKWVELRLVTILELEPRGGVPLMSSTFFNDYRMEVLHISQDGSKKRAKVKCMIESSLSCAKDLLIRLEQSINAEGWYISKGGAQTDCWAEFLSAELHCSRLADASDLHLHIAKSAI